LKSRITAFNSLSPIIDRDRITEDCMRGYRFLADLTDDERRLAAHPYQRERALHERLTAEIKTM
jgi:hypothetical protein